LPFIDIAAFYYHFDFAIIVQIFDSREQGGIITGISDNLIPVEFFTCLGIQSFTCGVENFRNAIIIDVMQAKTAPLVISIFEFRGFKP
jgi:hypothetical protein